MAVHRRPKTGARIEAEHYTKIFRRTCEQPAWTALSTVAQALYPWLKFEWRGPDANNNGRLQLSVRQAARRLGVSINTAAEAFRDLQRKGFIVQTSPAHLGVEGMAKAPTYEITELRLPTAEKGVDGRKLYRDWSPGRDFPVAVLAANNPLGRNGRKTKTRLKNHDAPVSKTMTDLSSPVSNSETQRLKNDDGTALGRGSPVSKTETSLSYHTRDAASGPARQPAIKSGQAPRARSKSEKRDAVRALLRATVSAANLPGEGAHDDAA